jgi:hypothetical protein
MNRDYTGCGPTLPAAFSAGTPLNTLGSAQPVHHTQKSILLKYLFATK